MTDKTPDSDLNFINLTETVLLHFLKRERDESKKTILRYVHGNFDGTRKNKFHCILSAVLLRIFRWLIDFSFNIQIKKHSRDINLKRAILS